MKLITKNSFGKWVHVSCFIKAGPIQGVEVCLRCNKAILSFTDCVPFSVGYTKGSVHYACVPTTAKAEDFDDFDRTLTVTVTQSPTSATGSSESAGAGTSTPVTPQTTAATPLSDSQSTTGSFSPDNTSATDEPASKKPRGRRPGCFGSHKS